MSIVINSEPQGAKIYDGNRFVGTTPTVYDAAKGSTETITLTARLDGYN